jgi:hypothetical protein
MNVAVVSSGVADLPGHGLNGIKLTRQIMPAANIQTIIKQKDSLNSIQFATSGNNTSFVLCQNALQQEKRGPLRVRPETDPHPIATARAAWRRSSCR